MARRTWKALATAVGAMLLLLGASISAFTLPMEVGKTIFEIWDPYREQIGGSLIAMLSGFGLLWWGLGD